MNKCCRAAPPDAAAQRRDCPRSRTAGAAVSRSTVKALLTDHALQRISRAPYWFCADPACDVVYFDDHGEVFTVTDIRVPIWQKEPFGARTVCYCFGENEAAMLREFPSKAVERVRAHIAAGRCACDLRNPRGACCLADLIAAVRRIEASRHDLQDR